MIVKEKGRWVVKAHKSRRRFGSYRSIAAAKKRLQQIKMFQRLGDSLHPKKRKK